MPDIAGAKVSPLFSLFNASLERRGCFFFRRILFFPTRGGGGHRRGGRLYSESALAAMGAGLCSTAGGVRGWEVRAGLFYKATT